MDTKFIDDILNNDFVNILIFTFVVLYHCVLLPKIPQPMLDLADNMFFKIFIITMIAFLANRNLRISLLIAISFVVTLNIVNKTAVENYINY